MGEELAFLGGGRERSEDGVVNGVDYEREGWRRADLRGAATGRRGSGRDV